MNDRIAGGSFIEQGLRERPVCAEWCIILPYPGSCMRTMLPLHHTHHGRMVHTLRLRSSTLWENGAHSAPQASHGPKENSLSLRSMPPMVLRRKKGSLRSMPPMVLRREEGSLRSMPPMVLRREGGLSAQHASLPPGYGTPCICLPPYPGMVHPVYTSLYTLVYASLVYI